MPARIGPQRWPTRLANTTPVQLASSRGANDSDAVTTNSVLFGVLKPFLTQGWSPSQISGTLKRMWPDEPQRTVSHECVYTCMYTMPKGELRKDRIARLRRAKARRMPRNWGDDRRGKKPDLLSIHVRPPEASDRAFPGHWEGDLFKGACNRSAASVLVERDFRLIMLIKHVYATASSALEDFTARLCNTAEAMARHPELTTITGVMVYFYEPHNPWQRGSCENTNGLIRQYRPKGTVLSVHSQEQLDAIADLLNNRPPFMTSTR